MCLENVFANPLQLPPKLVQMIGRNEAMIFMQIKYWCDKNESKNINFEDGHYWMYLSVRAWKEQIPFLSEKTIQRTLIKLKELDIVKVGEYNKMGADRTKWYTPNYSKLKQVEIEHDSKVKAYGQNVLMV